MSGSIYAVIALGFNLLLSVSRVVNLAQGEFLMLSGLIYYSLVHGFRLPVFFGLVISVCLVVLLGIATERLTLRPVRRSPPAVILMVTIAVGEIFKGAALNIWGADSYRVPAMFSTQPIKLGPLAVQPQGLILFSGTILIFVLLWLFLNRTVLGQVMLAVAEDPETASLLGVRSIQIVVLGMTLSAAVAALGGILVGPITLMNYHEGTFIGIKGLIASLIGGPQWYAGALLGGLLLGLLEAFGSAYFSSLLRDVFSFGGLLLILFFRPGGLAPGGRG